MDQESSLGNMIIQKKGVFVRWSKSTNWRAGGPKSHTELLEEKLTIPQFGQVGPVSEKIEFVIFVCIHLHCDWKKIGVKQSVNKIGIEPPPPQLL